MGATFETVGIDRKSTLVVVAAAILAAGLQALHFLLYYDQPLLTSVIWGIVDWSVWFALVGGLFLAGRNFVVDRSTLVRVLVYLVIVASSGVLHILITTAVYRPIFEPVRPFMRDVVHLLDKRWLQNIFISAVLVQALHLLWPAKRSPGPTGRDSEGDERRILTLRDGHRVHRIAPSEILFVESARNYLIVHTREGNIIVREPLKSMAARLSPHGFIRVSRSCVVRRDDVRGLERYSKNSIHITIGDGTTLKVGRTYVPQVRRALEHKE